MRLLLRFLFQTSRSAFYALLLVVGAIEAVLLIRNQSFLPPWAWVIIVLLLLIWILGRQAWLNWVKEHPESGEERMNLEIRQQAKPILENRRRREREKLEAERQGAREQQQRRLAAESKALADLNRTFPDRVLQEGLPPPLSQSLGMQLSDLLARLHIIRGTRVANEGEMRNLYNAYAEWYVETSTWLGKHLPGVIHDSFAVRGIPPMTSTAWASEEPVLRQRMEQHHEFLRSLWQYVES